MPMRFCLNKTGPGESSLMIIATISIGNAKTMIAKNDSTISIALLKKCLYIFTSHYAVKIKEFAVNRCINALAYRDFILSNTMSCPVGMFSQSEI